MMEYLYGDDDAPIEKSLGDTALPSDNDLNAVTDDRLRNIMEATTSIVGNVLRDHQWNNDAQYKGMRRTPERFAKMLAELTGGYDYVDGRDVLKVTFDDDGVCRYNGMVIIKDIPFTSLCEHHIAPFMGRVHIGYVPSGYVAGLSKFSRLTNIYAHRLQMQERMTLQIANDIFAFLNPRGCAVVCEAIHTCMCNRGAKALGSSTITSVMKGVFLDQASARAEFMQLIKD